jgi:hypothetical protein
MDAEALADFMVRRGTLTPQALARARRRQHLYGGGLDTILLELGLADEATLGNGLAQVTGLLRPRPEWLESPAPEATRLCDAAMARRLGAVPLALDGERLRVVVRPGSSLQTIFDWAAERQLDAECFIVAEPRFEALLASVYAAPVPPRYASVLGRLVGAERARRLNSAHAMRPLPITAPPVDTGPVVRPLPPPPEPDIEIVEELPASGLEPAPPEMAPKPADHETAPRADDHRAPQPIHEAAAVTGGDEAALLAALDECADYDGERRQQLLVALRPHRASAGLRARLAIWRRTARGAGAHAHAAIAALAEVRDKGAVPLLIERLDDDDQALATAAHAALVALSAHDFGRASAPWERFWRERGQQHRVEWLLEALQAREPELRLLAARDLEELGGYVGYHYDLGKRDREEARRRWADWWQRKGRARYAAEEADADRDG